MASSDDIVNTSTVSQLEMLVAQGWMIILREDVDKRGKITMMMSRREGEMRRGDGRSLEVCLTDMHDIQNPKEVN